MRSLTRFIVAVTVSLLCASGLCQSISQPQLHSVSPSVWVLKGDGKVFVLPTPTPTVTSLPKEIMITLPGDVKLEMVLIPAGTFMMGSPDNEQDRHSNEGPQHSVTISQDFYLGKYEVTKEQWQAVMSTAPWSGEPYVLDDPKSPAVWMSWDDSQSFTIALNQLSRGTFRLPSEAEWEYACRAGTTTRFYWGDDLSYTQIGHYVWYTNNAWKVNEQYAHVVGLKLPNVWGLCDMSGNVLEWCQDGWHSNYSDAPSDGNAWEADSIYRVLRCDCWHGGEWECRSANRSFGSQTYRHPCIGLRLVRNP